MPPRARNIACETRLSGEIVDGAVAWSIAESMVGRAPASEFAIFALHPRMVLHVVPMARRVSQCTNRTFSTFRTTSERRPRSRGDAVAWGAFGHRLPAGCATIASKENIINGRDSDKNGGRRYLAAVCIGVHSSRSRIGNELAKPTEAIRVRLASARGGGVGRRRWDRHDRGYGHLLHIGWRHRAGTHRTRYRDRRHSLG